MLPEIKDNADDFGTSDKPVLGAAIPIRGAAGDQQAATIGQACFDPGMMKSTYGTGCFALLNTGTDIVRSKNRLLTTVAYRLNGKSTYALEGAIFMAGASVQWLRDRLRLFKDAGETGAMAKASDPASEVYLVPAFVGLGAPWWDADARGAIYGLTRNTGASDLARAALESVAYQTQDLLPPCARTGRARGHGPARRWRHGCLRLDHAVPERHSRRAVDRPDDPRDDGAGRGLARRLQGRRLARHEGLLEALVARPAVQSGDGRHRAQAQARRLARRRAPDADEVAQLIHAEKGPPAMKHQ